MTKEELFAKCPTLRVSFNTSEGLSCNAEAILVNHIHAAFDDTRLTDCTCQCGRCCRTTVGGGNVHWCINPDCENFQVHIIPTNGPREH